MKSDGPIDLVVPWCDAADTVWAANKDALARRLGLPVGDEANAVCRFAGNDDLKYALRSFELFVPWVRKIFLLIADDAMPPAWLDTNHPRLEIVRHSAFIPALSLPTYSADTIEHHLARIPGLAPRFLFANDDTLFYRPTSPAFFFARDGYPIFRFGAIKPDLPDGEKTVFRQTIDRAVELIRAAYPSADVGLAKALPRMSHHCIDAYCTEDYAACRARHAAAIDPTINSHFRSATAVNRVLYAYDALARGHGHYRLARFRHLERRAWWKRLLRPGYADTLCFVRERWRTGSAELVKWRPFCFCFNDTLGTTEEDRVWLRGVYAAMYPSQSSFELTGVDKR